MGLSRIAVRTTRPLPLVKYLWDMGILPTRSLLWALSMAIILGPTDLAAQTSWRRTYGGLGTEAATQVATTSDDGYLVTGTCGSFGNGASDIYLLRLDAEGEVIWSRTYGSVAVDQGAAVAVLDDGLAVAGSSAVGGIGGYDFVLVRADENGEVLWQRNYGTEDWDLCHTMIALEDGFILGGISYGDGAPEGQGFLVRTDLNGDVLWTTRTQEELGASCQALAVNSDGRVVLAGYSVQPNGDTDRLLAVFDPDGEPLWRLSLPGDSTDMFADVLLTADDRIVAIGTSFSYGPVAVINMHATDMSGAELWDRTIGNSADAWGTGIAIAHGVGFVITGYNTLNLGAPDMIYTRLDNDGYWLEGGNYGNGAPAQGIDIQATADGGYVVAGWIEGAGPGARSVYVVKTNGNGQTTSLTVNTFLDPINVDDVPSNDETMFPTLLTSDATTLNTQPLSVTSLFIITDSSGRLLHRTHLPAGTSTIHMPAMRPGLYVCYLEGGAQRSVQRMVRIAEGR
jgi:hypothetical protein